MGKISEKKTSRGKNKVHAMIFIISTIKLLYFSGVKNVSERCLIFVFNQIYYPKGVLRIVQRDKFSKSKFYQVGTLMKSSFFDFLKRA